MAFPPKTTDGSPTFVGSPFMGGGGGSHRVWCQNESTKTDGESRPREVAFSTRRSRNIAFDLSRSGAPRGGERSRFSPASPAYPEPIAHNRLSPRWGRREFENRNDGDPAADPTSRENHGCRTLLAIGPTSKSKRSSGVPIGTALKIGPRLAPDFSKNYNLLKLRSKVATPTGFEPLAGSIRKPKRNAILSNIRLRYLGFWAPAAPRARAGRREARSPAARAQAARPAARARAAARVPPRK
jgi:hypothetical protein